MRQRVGQRVGLKLRNDDRGSSIKDYTRLGAGRALKCVGLWMGLIGPFNITISTEQINHPAK